MRPFIGSNEKVRVMDGSADDAHNRRFGAWLLWQVDPSAAWTDLDLGLAHAIIHT
jgi:hypothetical protein